MSGTLTEVLRLPLEKKRATLAVLLGENGQRTRLFPVSFAQQRLWFLDQLESGTAAYNIPCALRLKGALRVRALAQSLNEIVARHETLRTTFRALDGQPMQAIAESRPAELPVVELSQLGRSVRQAELARLASEEARRPFDLARGPLLRASLLRLGDDEHVLLLTMHHIVSDGWSMSVLLRELVQLYGAFSEGQPSPLAPLQVQYTDYAQWQREWLQGELLEKQLSYWRKQLGGASPLLDLPTDRLRPAVQTFRGAIQTLVLPKRVAEQVKTLSQLEGVTPFMTLLASFQVLLHRYTVRDDILVGVPIAGRNQPEIEELVGFFVNTLVIRTDLSGNPTFRELLGRVRKVALEAYEHQDVPFEKLVEDLQPERSLSYNPMFQVMFAAYPAPAPVVEMSGLTLSPLGVHSGTSRFDLTLFMADQGNGWRFELEFNTDLFDATRIIRMLGHYKTLLEGIAADPDRRLSALPLLTDAEQRQLVVDWNSTAAEYPRDQCIHQLFEAQVERTPRALAAVFKEQRLTYDELNARANQLAHALRKRGVGPEVPVGLAVERSLEMVVGVLGILKAGGAYLPLDPTWPTQRLAFMLEDARVPLLLTQRQIMAKLPENAAQVICLDIGAGAIAQESTENPSVGAEPDDLAYLIYTSGSTGHPKAVRGLHRGALNRFAWMWKAYPFAEGECCCQKTSLSFVDSAWEIFGPLLQGMKTVIIPNEEVTDPHRLVETLATHRITRIVLVPSLLRVLLEVYGDLQRRLPKLRMWVTSGEVLPLDLCECFQKSMPDCVLLNLYGSSEVSGDATWYDTREINGELPSVPIGRPIANTQAYVLDRYLNPVPVGIPGELYLSGDGLADGYLNRPELTAANFIPNPFGNQNKAGLYKTGDQARYLADGNLEFLGRTDDQIKIRGLRIHLGEIEAALRQHPAVRDAVVAYRGSSGNKRLVAYWVARDLAALPEGAFRQFLRERLPEHMVPSSFVPLATLPLTPSGKVDRQALPLPSRAHSELQPPWVAPRDTLELELAKIWENVLGVEPIGVTDNFFDLGGHSLLAARLFAEVEKTIGKRMPLASLFKAPTIEQLTRVLSEQDGAPPWCSLIAIQPGGSRSPLFCVHGHSGEILFYRYLSQHLGPDQPFFGLQAQGLSGKPAHYTVEAMAADYIREIRSVQREGPYYVGGYCFGGVVALEIAQHLRAHGQDVALLAMLGTLGRGPRVPRPFVKKLIERAQMIRLHLQKLRPLGAKEKLNYLLGIIQRRICRIALKYYSRDGRSLPRAIENVAEINLRAAKHYVPKVYQGRIALFMSSEMFRQFPSDPTFGWGSIGAGGVSVHEIPGNPGSMMRDPHVGILAERMKVYLDKTNTEIHAPRRTSSLPSHDLATQDSARARPVLGPM